jgi:hypothetical protein
MQFEPEGDRVQQSAVQEDGLARIRVLPSLHGIFQADRYLSGNVQQIQGKVSVHLFH